MKGVAGRKCTLIMPLKVAATSVKFAIPPPTRRAFLQPSGFAVALHMTIGADQCPIASRCLHPHLSMVGWYAYLTHRHGWFRPIVW